VRFAAVVLAIAAPAGVLWGLGSDGSARGASVDFQREIRPLLSDRCFACHGPDEKARQGERRLDLREGAIAQNEGVRAIEPGAPDRSELLRRVEAEGEDAMPPRDSGRKPLTAQERALVRRWIEQGAEYAPHWAFVAPAKPTVPAVRQASWCVNEMDHFVLSRLEAEGLAPSARASAATLARRLTLDLTGLPPTPEQTAELEAVNTDAGVARFVDKLLASPAYGERMAADWLDLARYADTYGYQADAHRRVWPYRDWVIRAFSENMPYNEFVVKQLAGDLLPSATESDRLATAFQRLHRQTNEGGSTEEEFRVEYVADRVHTFGTAFLGLTLECARCHDHKFDPVTQEDYYSLFAFFQNIDEAGCYSHFTDATPTPALDLPSPEQAAALAAARAGVERAEAELQRVEREGEVRFEQWSKIQRAVPAGRGPVARYPLTSIREGKLENLVNPQMPGAAASALNCVEAQVPSGAKQALRFTGDDAATFPGVGEWAHTDAFSVALWIRAPEASDRAVLLRRSRAWTDAGSQGYELILDEGRLRWSLIHFWPGNAASVRCREKVEPERWTQVIVTHDGSGRSAGLRIFVNGAPADLEVVRDSLTRPITGGDPGPPALGERFRDVGFKGGEICDLQFYDRCLPEAEVRAVSGMGADAPSAELSLRAFLETVDEPAARAREALRAARGALAKAQAEIPQIMAMAETAPQPCFVLSRGRYDAPDRARPVSARVPKALPPLEPGFPTNRLGLARWLTGGGHPLAARVAVNRLWMFAFGRGLVATPENFGSQGELPSHPELLDWLAVTFVESGWDVKAMLKRIVMSATYRQASASRPDLAARDPQNRLLARYPAHRLTAEQIRDQALFASGLLVSKVGGPSVKPWQPPGLWEIGWGGSYQADEGEGRHRRSLYTYWRRTVPPPNMMLFDAAKREVCSARRQATMTPLQSLVLLNDPQFVETAQALAERAAAPGRGDDAQIADAFGRVCGRAPSEAEAKALLDLLQQERAAGAAHPMAAVCSVLLASDAAVMVR